jgi:Effector-associated domain 1
MNLTGQQLGELRALVRRAITNQDDLARLVSDRMNIRLLDHVKPAGLETIVFELFTWLEANRRTEDFIHALIKARPHLKEQLGVFLKHERTPPRSISPQLTYCRATEIDPDRISSLLNSREPPQISYFETLAGAVTKLRARDRAPEDFFRQYPGVEEMDAEQRAERASGEHARNGDILRETEKVADRHERALHRLLQCIKELEAPTPLAAKSLETFASLAALYMIRELKKGFDWVNGQAQPWFEAFKFGKDGSGSFAGMRPEPQPDRATGFRLSLLGHGSCWSGRRVSRHHVPSEIRLALVSQRGKGER